MNEPFSDALLWPYMLSEGDAVRFLGLTPGEFRHVAWLKRLHCFPAGERNYYLRAILQKVADELFAESQELGARLHRLSPELFWRQYDVMYGSRDQMEMVIRENLEKELKNHDIGEVARSMNFGNSMNLFHSLAALEKTRIVSVLLELGVLTESGLVYHACLAQDLEDY